MTQRKGVLAHSGASYPAAALPTSVHQRPSGWLLCTRTFQGGVEASAPGGYQSPAASKAWEHNLRKEIVCTRWATRTLHSDKPVGSCGGLYLGPREARRTQPRTFPRGFGETEPPLGGSRWWRVAEKPGEDRTLSGLRMESQDQKQALLSGASPSLASSHQAGTSQDKRWLTLGLSRGRGHSSGQWVP